MRLRVHPAPTELGSAVGSPEQSAVVGRRSGRAIEDPPDQDGNADGGHGLAGEGFKDRRVGFGPEVDDQLATIHAVQQ